MSGFGCLETANSFLLSREDALEISEIQKHNIKTYWSDVCDEAELSKIDRTFSGKGNL